MLFVRTLFAEFVPLVEDESTPLELLLLELLPVFGLSAIISTLNRTFLARNLSGDLYSHRNKLGLFIL
jgi:hypothetical protein